MSLRLFYFTLRLTALYSWQTTSVMFVFCTQACSLALIPRFRYTCGGHGRSTCSHHGVELSPVQSSSAPMSAAQPRCPSAPKRVPRAVPLSTSCAPSPAETRSLLLSSCCLSGSCQSMPGLRRIGFLLQHIRIILTLSPHTFLWALLVLH